MEASRRTVLTAGLLGAGAALTGCSPPGTDGATPATTADRAVSSAAPASTPSAAAAASPTTPTTPQPAPPSLSLPEPHHSFDDPRSPWVVVNKRRALQPENFVPPDLRRPAVPTSATGESALLNSTTAAAAERMFAAAAAEGVGLVLASGYRSFTTQERVYGTYAETRGTADTDTASARPGHSEHQTGWAFDIGDSGGACAFQPCFASQPAALWAARRAHEFGFIVRYLPGMEAVTGYLAEPWHLRYIGVEASMDMARRGVQTLEQYFGFPPAPGYN